jgi:hypothetical protein
MTHTWQITTVDDAARARIAAARLAAAHGVATVERTRLVTALSAQLRQCLVKGGGWLLTLRTAAPARTGCPGRLTVTLEAKADGTGVNGAGTDGTRADRTGTDGAGSSDAASNRAADGPSWQASVGVPEPGHGDGGGAARVPRDRTALADALLSADEDTSRVLDQLTEQERLVAFHREELHQTNQGVLALHAELDAAGRVQRELYGAERKARTEAESARRRLTFLADASAALTASLNHEEILSRTGPGAPTYGCSPTTPRPAGTPPVRRPPSPPPAPDARSTPPATRAVCPASTTSLPPLCTRRSRCCASRCRAGTHPSACSR